MHVICQQTESGP